MVDFLNFSSEVFWFLFLFALENVGEIGVFVVLGVRGFCVEMLVKQGK